MQSTLLSRVSINGVKPDLLLVLVSTWSLLRGSKEGSQWALAGGIALDLLSGAPFGVCTLSLVAVSLLSGLEQLRMFQASFLLPVVVVALSALAHDAVFLFCLQLVEWPVSWSDSLLNSTLPGMVLSLALLPFLYPILRQMSRRTEAEDNALYLRAW